MTAMDPRGMGTQVGRAMDDLSAAGLTSAKPTPEASDLSTDLEHLRHALGMLDNECSALADNLKPVLQHEEPAVEPRDVDQKPSADAPRPLSDLGAQLLELTRNTNRLRYRMQRIRERLDLPEVEGPF